jgi:hypothetical protein
VQYQINLKLLKVSEVVLGAPFSQVKCERDFCYFALIYSHLRTRIGDDILNELIIVRKNIDLLDGINIF